MRRRRCRVSRDGRHEWIAQPWPPSRHANRVGSRLCNAARIIGSGPMAVYKQPKSKYWWFKFVWNGKAIRESTKQTNRRVAEQMEAARRTQLAKGEVGIRDLARIPTLAEF